MFYGLEAFTHTQNLPFHSEVILLKLAKGEKLDTRPARDLIDKLGQGVRGVSDPITALKIVKSAEWSLKTSQLNRFTELILQV